MDKAEKELSGENSGPAETVAEPRLTIFGGLVAAIMVATLLRPPIPARMTLGKGIAAALAWMAASLVAGALGMAATASVRNSRVTWPSPRFATEAAAAWILIPPLLLCSLLGSPWALIVSAGAAAAIAVCLAKTAPSQREEPAFEPEEHGPHFAALPPSDSGRGKAFAVALCVEGAAAFLLRQQLFLATVLMAAGSFLLVQKRLANSRGHDGLARPAGRAAIAAVFAILILVPLLLARFVKTDSAAVNAAQAASQSDDQKNRMVDDAYRGIILFTVTEHKKELPPVPLRRDLLRAGAARLLVIPFNGSYWYFQAPQDGPGLHPHLTHGDPVSASIYSTGRIPLAMQAHQTLAQPIDLASCGELDVAIRNGDNRPGRIEMGVLLSDSALPGKPSMYLGIQPVASTLPEHFAIKKAPIDEQLQFLIPTHPGLRRFDEITVFFFPDVERLTQGARIGIDHFELIPR